MEEEHWLRIGVAATLAREYAADQRQFLEDLARLVERALPGQVEVRRAGGLFSRTRPVRSIRVELGDERYSLEDRGSGPLLAARSLVKRGIVLNSEELGVEQWIEVLGAALQEYADEHQSAADALRRFLG